MPAISSVLRELSKWRPSLIRSRVLSLWSENVALAKVLECSVLSLRELVVALRHGTRVSNLCTRHWECGSADLSPSV